MPYMNRFLWPFCAKVRKYFSEDLAWAHSEIGRSAVSRTGALLAAASAVAKALFKNLKQFSGMYGCSSCEHPQEINMTQMGYLVYTVLDSMLCAVIKTAYADFWGYRKGNSSEGHKRAICTELDAKFWFGIRHRHRLHALCVTWCGKSDDDLTLNITKLCGTFPVTLRILMRSSWVKPPDFITQTPRSLKHRSHWKASEYRPLQKDPRPQCPTMVT